jgi:hypothetical protein
MQGLGKLHDFIKDIFESKELFALAYGDLHKNYSVIFIDGEDIVIPVENINSSITIHIVFY